MGLWVEWMSLVNRLEGAFKRKKTFFWFVVVLFGFTVKFDAFGVTSLVRGAGVLPSCYTSMLNFFHSGAVNLFSLRQLWVGVIFRYFSGIARINNRVLIVGDGIKVAKEGLSVITLFDGHFFKIIDGFYCNKKSTANGSALQEYY